MVVHHFLVLCLAYPLTVVSTIWHITVYLRITRMGHFSIDLYKTFQVESSITSV